MAKQEQRVNYGLKHFEVLHESYETSFNEKPPSEMKYRMGWDLDDNKDTDNFSVTFNYDLFVEKDLKRTLITRIETKSVFQSPEKQRFIGIKDGEADFINDQVKFTIIDVVIGLTRGAHAREAYKTLTFQTSIPFYPTAKSLFK